MILRAGLETSGRSSRDVRSGSGWMTCQISLKGDSRPLPCAVSSPKRHSAENPEGSFVHFVYFHLQLPASCLCVVDFLAPAKLTWGWGVRKGQ